MVSNCGISKILQAIVHDGCPSLLASKKLSGGANIIVNIFVNIRPILNIVVSLDCYCFTIVSHAWNVLTMVICLIFFCVFFLQKRHRGSLWENMKYRYQAYR